MKPDEVPRLFELLPVWWQLGRCNFGRHIMIHIQYITDADWPQPIQIPDVTFDKPMKLSETDIHIYHEDAWFSLGLWRNLCKAELNNSSGQSCDPASCNQSYYQHVSDRHWPSEGIPADLQQPNYDTGEDMRKLVYHGLLVLVHTSPRQKGVSINDDQWAHRALETGLKRYPGAAKQGGVASKSQGHLHWHPRPILHPIAALFVLPKILAPCQAPDSRFSRQRCHPKCREEGWDRLWEPLDRLLPQEQGKIRRSILTMASPLICHWYPSLLSIPLKKWGCMLFCIKTRGGKGRVAPC